ncbi:hypothetical protein ACPA9J_02310 [Pseudomonas aeruginosa]
MQGSRRCCAGLEALAVEPLADPRLGGDHVHRPGHPLRELHPSVTSSRPCPRPGSARCWR